MSLKKPPKLEDALISMIEELGFVPDPFEPNLFILGPVLLWVHSGEYLKCFLPSVSRILITDGLHKPLWTDWIGLSIDIESLKFRLKRELLECQAPEK